MLPQPTRRRFLHMAASAGAALITSSAQSEQPSGKDKQSERKRSDAPFKGPLRVHPKNARYFTDDSGKPIYLTGAHTWYNLQDMGLSDPPPVFKYDAHLDFLEKHNHNFMRLWRWELAKWTESHFKGVRYCEPHPWKRTGPDKALDGKPKFDLKQLDPAYFDRLRARVAAAGKRRLYVSIMLFEGWGLSFASWDGHPFNVHNNVQEINGDPDGDGKGIKTHTLALAAVTDIQKTYVRKVIDTVNDLDNVLFEIANESNFAHSKEWQYHMIRFVKEYERKKLKQHPVGMTGYTQSDNKAMIDSPADWISLGGTGRTNEDGPYKNDPPVADGKKVSLLDTDHIYGVGGGRDWAWKSFLRGHNVLWMDPYDKSSIWEHVPGNADEVRRNMGEIRRFAEKMNLAAMAPANDVSSSRYCLANPGSEYLTYLPQGGAVTVDLSKIEGSVAVEWNNPSTGKASKAPSVAGGMRRDFKAPFEGDAVLYLVRVHH